MDQPRITHLNLNYTPSVFSMPHCLSASRFCPESFYWYDLHHPKECSDLREALCQERQPEELNDISSTQKPLKIPKAMLCGVRCHSQEPASSKWLIKTKEKAKGNCSNERVAWHSVFRWKSISQGPGKNITLWLGVWWEFLGSPG